MKTGDFVAVYGSLRYGLGNHRLLKDSERHKDGVIPAGNFKMISLGAFPGLLKDPEGSTIQVEVYTVDSAERQRALDSLEGFPSFYDREFVELEDGRKCWVYFLANEVGYKGNPVVPSGDWMENFKDNYL